MKWISGIFRVCVLSIALAALHGCELSVGSSVPVGKFTASYYDNTTLIASEEVDRPSINYNLSDFHGIDSNNFHAIWIGNIDVGSAPKLIDINFDVSWSDVTLTIDGTTVSSWSNSNKVIPYTFSPGIHSIEIEYFNNWFTTGFNTSFTTNTMYTKDEAIGLVSPLIDTSTKIVYVGAYESGDLYNNTTVNLASSSNKVFLFLTSYDSLDWVINNPYGVQITGIAYSSYSTVSTVTAGSSVPTYEISGLAYGYSDFTAPSADILYITGRAPDATYGEYSMTSANVAIP